MLSDRRCAVTVISWIVSLLLPASVSGAAAAGAVLKVVPPRMAAIASDTFDFMGEFMGDFVGER